jgi:hypothetical protein
MGQLNLDDGQQRRHRRTRPAAAHHPARVIGGRPGRIDQVTRALRG